MNVCVFLSIFACTRGPTDAISAADRWAAPPAAVAIPADNATTLAVQLTVRAGSAYDPPGQEGLATLTARAVLHGGDPSLSERLHALGSEPGQLEVNAELVRFTTTVPAENFARFVPLYAELFTMSQPSPELLERLQEQAMSPALRFGGALAAHALDLWINQGHPYGHAARGRPSAVSTLTEQDVHRFYASRYVRSAVAVGVTGDPAHARALSDALGALPAAKSEPATPRPRPQADALSLLIVPEQSSESVVIHLGQPIALRANDPRLPALVLGLRAMGAPSAQSDLVASDLRALTPEIQLDRIQPHAVFALEPAPPEQTATALTDAISRLDRALTEGIEPARLDAARAELRATATSLSAEPPLRLDAALLSTSLGVPDPLSALPDLWGALTPEEVNAAAKASIKPGVWRVVVVTSDAASVVSALGEESATTPVYPDDPAAPSPSVSATVRLKPAKILTISPEELEQ